MSAWLVTAFDLDPGSGGGEPPPSDPPPELGPIPGPPDPPDPGPPPEDGVPPPERVSIERWITERDAKVCPICGPLDGQEWDAGDGPYPPAHINCRCRRVAVGYALRTPTTDRPGDYIRPNPWTRGDW